MQTATEEVPQVHSSSPGTALALRSPSVDLDRYVPKDLAELRQLARDAHASKLTKARNPEQAQMQMMTGHELGIAPMASLRMVYIADFGQGEQPTVSADGMRAACLFRKDLCRYFRTVELTEERAVVETHRVGDPEPVRRQFTQEDAKRAKLGQVKEGKDKDSTNWAKYPRMMLRHRADAELAREVYPDILGGMYTPEEAAESAESARTERQVGPAVTPLPTAARAAAPIVEADVVGGESDERRIVAALEAATAKADVDELANEALRVWPKVRPESVKQAHLAAKARTKAAPVVTPAPAAPESEKVDKSTGEVTGGRQPGEDDA